MNSRHLILILPSLGAALLFGACNRTPKGVLSQEEMAQLMADTYMGEGVVDANSEDFNSDSSRMYLRESIYKAHGLTRADVDRSFDYYGNHIEDYIKVLDRSEEILHDKQKSLSAASSRQLSLSGDSVNIWSGASRITVSPRLPSRYITFTVAPDTTWHNGDTYELRYKLINSRRPVESHVFVDYAEGVTRRYDTEPRAQGFTSLRFEIDSTLTPRRFYGYIDLNPAPGEHFHLDSISLVRSRHGRDFFMSRGREILWNKHRDYRKTDRTSADSASSQAPFAASYPSAPAAESGRTPAQQTTRELPPATVGPGAVGSIRVKR